MKKIIFSSLLVGLIACSHFVKEQQSPIQRGTASETIRITDKDQLASILADPMAKICKEGALRALGINAKDFSLCQKVGTQIAN